MAQAFSLSTRLARLRSFVHGWVRPLVDIRQVLSIWRYGTFIRDWYSYAHLEGAEPIHFFDTQPCVHDRTKHTGLDRQYFFQDIWAFRKVYASRVEAHVDIASRIEFAGMLAAVTHVTFIDIRPALIELKGFESRKGTIVDLPFLDASVASLSCLHVAEHVGLGRYGDSLDALGTKKAAGELRRVLANGGNLYFSVPIGKPRLCFNAHRIHSSKQILEYFAGLDLIEFSAVDDNGSFQENADPHGFENSRYSCGMFWFRKLQ
jgi:hypothetical protein